MRAGSIVKPERHIIGGVTAERHNLEVRIAPSAATSRHQPRTLSTLCGLNSRISRTTYWRMMLAGMPPFSFMNSL